MELTVAAVSSCVAKAASEELRADEAAARAAATVPARSAD